MLFQKARPGQTQQRIRRAAVLRRATVPNAIESVYCCTFEKRQFQPATHPEDTPGSGDCAAAENTWQKTTRRAYIYIYIWVF